MSVAPRVIPAAALLPLAEAQGTATEPLPIFRAVEEFCRAWFGFQLLTILRHLPESGEIERIYSTNPEVYPAGGRKKMGGTPWGRVVLDAGETWLGNGAEAIRWAYPDAELTLSMGREASFCAPIRAGGRTLGVLNLSAGRDHFDPADAGCLAIAAAFLGRAVGMMECIVRDG